MNMASHTMLLSLFFLTNLLLQAYSFPLEEDQGRIKVTVLNDPHDLIIGDCRQKKELLHQQNIVVNNDGKSHVNAEIKVIVDDNNAKITCVLVLDKIDGKGGYPKYTGGGVDHNFVTFNVTTKAGEGFDYFVRIYGNPSNATSTN